MADAPESADAPRVELPAGPAVLNLEIGEGEGRNLTPWGPGDAPKSIGALSTSFLFFTGQVGALLSLVVAFVNARAAESFALLVGYSAMIGNFSRLSARVDVLEAKIQAIELARAGTVPVAAKPLFERQSSREAPIGPNPASLAGEAAKVAKLHFPHGIVKKLPSDKVPIDILILLLVAIGDHVTRYGSLPFGWASDFLDMELRTILVASKVPLGWAKNPCDAKEWLTFLEAYVAKFGPQLVDELKALDYSILVAAGEPLSLATVQSKLGLGVYQIQKKLEASCTDSVERADARKLVFHALAKIVPPSVAARFYLRIGCSHSDEPPPHITFDDAVGYMYTALKEIWEESTIHNKQGDVFVKKASPPAAPAAGTPPKSAKSAGDKPISFKRAPAAAPTESAPNAGAGKADAGAGKVDGGSPSGAPKSADWTCKNCNNPSHRTRQCRKPCKSHVAGNCTYGRKCLLGPVVPNKHGDDRPAPRSAPAAAETA